jgi:hypothetical protein
MTNKTAKEVRDESAHHNHAMPAPVGGKLFNPPLVCGVLIAAMMAIAARSASCSASAP